MKSPRCTHDIPPMYSWYPPDVLNTPRCTEHPLMYWTSPDVLNTHYTGWLLAGNHLSGLPVLVITWLQMHLQIKTTFIRCSRGEFRFGQKSDKNYKRINIKIHTQPATLAHCQKVNDYVWLKVSPSTKNENGFRWFGIKRNAVFIYLYADLNFLSEQLHFCWDSRLICRPSRFSHHRKRKNKFWNFRHSAAGRTVWRKHWGKTWYQTEVFEMALEKKIPVDAERRN